MIHALMMKADVWSFGILLLEMAHGQAPFAHCSLEETAVLVVNHSPPTLQQPTDGRIFTEVGAAKPKACPVATVMYTLYIPSVCSTVTVHLTYLY